MAMTRDERALSSVSLSDDAANGFDNRRWCTRRNHLRIWRH